jgi:hypothetical protein
MEGSNSHQAAETARADDRRKDIALERVGPDTGRELWHRLLETNMRDELAQQALAWVLQSVLVDHISNRMDSSDEYAVTIGRRIVTILEAIERSTDSATTSNDRQ